MQISILTIETFLYLKFNLVFKLIPSFLFLYFEILHQKMPSYILREAPTLNLTLVKHLYSKNDSNFFLNVTENCSLIKDIDNLFSYKNNLPFYIIFLKDFWRLIPDLLEETKQQIQKFVFSTLTTAVIKNH